MKIVNIRIGIVFILFLFMGCTRTNQPKEDLGRINFDDVWNVDSIAQSKEYRLVYVFDGNCSLCIMKLMELQRVLDSSLYEFPICPVFIAEKSDYDILSYNLEKNNFKYSVIYDSISILQTNNTSMNIRNNDIFILDRNNNVLFRSNSVNGATMRKFLNDQANE